MPLYLFAYGSLIWRPGFEYLGVRRGWVEGYERRFWQASHDHRGTPDQPGRVLTLVPVTGGRCEGMIYEIPIQGCEEMLVALDEREQDGYERVWLDAFSSIDNGQLRVLTWLALEENPSWVGDEPEERTASIIANCHGASGSNLEYLSRLHDALNELEIKDAHVEALALRISDKYQHSE